MAEQELIVPPLDANAEPICTLDRETALARHEPPDRFLEASLSESALEAGIEYVFPASEAMWVRLRTFISEEQQCCPFFAFHAREVDGTIVLKVFQP